MNKLLKEKMFKDMERKEINLIKNSNLPSYIKREKIKRIKSEIKEAFLKETNQNK